VVRLEIVRHSLQRMCGRTTAPSRHQANCQCRSA
jgi:hypothetical protein